MQTTTDEELIDFGRAKRSEAMASIYDQVAAGAPCRCTDSHREDSPDCPRAAWQQAARMAREMDD